MVHLSKLTNYLQGSRLYIKWKFSCGKRGRAAGVNVNGHNTYKKMTVREREKSNI